MTRKTHAQYKTYAQAQEAKAEAFRKEGAAYYFILADKADQRCRERRRVVNPHMRLEPKGIESSQVLALLSVMAEELFTLRKEISKLKGQEL